MLGMNFADVLETVRSEGLQCSARYFQNHTGKLLLQRSEKLPAKGQEHKETNIQHLSHHKLNRVMCP